MSKSYKTLALALAAVEPGSDDTAYVGKFKNVDYFILATSEDEAYSILAQEAGLILGPCPLDLILAAMKSGPAEAIEEEKPAAIILEKMQVADLKAIAKTAAIPLADGLKKAEIIAIIRSVAPDKYPTADAAGEFNFGKNGGE